MTMMIMTTADQDRTAGAQTAVPKVAVVRTAVLAAVLKEKQRTDLMAAL